MSAEQLLSRLDGVRRTGEGRWLARCPAHPDKRPSLSVRELPDGRVLMHDFAGCAIGEIVAAVGLDLSDLFPERSIKHAKGERRPFPAADVLRALADETLLVAVAAGNIAQGVTLTDADRERLLVAAERVQAGRGLALGN